VIVQGSLVLILLKHRTRGFGGVCPVAMVGEVTWGHYHQPPKPPWLMVNLEDLHMVSSFVL